VKACKVLQLLCFAALLSIGMNAFGAGREIPGYPNDVTANDSREVAMLPKYCIHTRTFRHSVPGGNNVAEVKRLQAIAGPTYEALHHYCWGLMKTNRALFLTNEKRVKEFYLRSANSDFDYVIVRAAADFPLLPEILTKKGENLALLRDTTAEGVLRRAIELKRDYWPAYAALSDHYKNMGQLAKSREVLEQGLSLAPDAKPLSTRLSQLRGRDAVKESRTTAPAD
jgi:tetratricopeptide (TPR) repeat protein